MPRRGARLALNLNPAHNDATTRQVAPNLLIAPVAGSTEYFELKLISSPLNTGRVRVQFPVCSASLGPCESVATGHPVRKASRQHSVQAKISR